MISRKPGLVLGFLFASAMILAPFVPAKGASSIQRWYRAVSFGVAPYGGARNVGGPTYIADNVTGRNDILTSPGLGTLGGYLTASPVVANSIASYAGALPLVEFQVGGGNGAVPSGRGQPRIWGRGWAWRWPIPAPAEVRPRIRSPVGTLPLPSPGPRFPLAPTMALTLTWQAAFPWLATPTLQACVSMSRTRPASLCRGLRSSSDGSCHLAQWGRGGDRELQHRHHRRCRRRQCGAHPGYAVMGALPCPLSVDNLAVGAALPVGDILSVSYAVTGFAYVCCLRDTFDPTNSIDLLNLTGPLPTDSLVGSVPTPEPGSLCLGVMGVIGLLFPSTLVKLAII